MNAVEHGVASYGAFFHRDPDSILNGSFPDGESEIVVARFPPINGGLLKRMFAALPDATVWITSGMSLREMKVPEESARNWDQRIELATFVPGSGYFAGDAGEDLVAQLLLMLAIHPFATDTWIGPCHTMTFPEPLVAGSDMSCVLYSVFEAEMPRLCSCTPGKATVVASVIPITSAECDFYRSQNDIMALIDLFEEHGVGPQFDPHRLSVV